MAIIGFDDGLEPSKMNEDEVIENFAELIRKNELAKTNQNLRSVIAKLEDSIRKNEKYKVKLFLVNMKTGLMLNADNAPNVSFRVDTINEIFDGFAESAQALGLTKEQTNQIFFDTGVRCGKNFGNNFNKYIETYIDYEETDEKILDWCTFDSSVGWGKFTYKPEEKTITIKNSFETKQNEVNGQLPRDCKFIQGYVVGVYSELANNGNMPEYTCETEASANSYNFHNCIVKFK